MRDGIGWLGGLVIVGLLALGIGTSLAYTYGTVETRQCTISDKDRSIKITSDSKGNTSSSTDMRVYTEECGILQAGDNIFRLQFNSADIYSQLKVGETYTLSTYGWRNGFFSVFPTIYEVKP